VAVSIKNNVSSLRAQRALADSTSLLTRTFERLSSGLRINRASDDAAGLAVSSSLNAGARVYTQGVRNINDGISSLNIAEGALSQASGIAGRLKELAIQSANGTFSNVQRRALNGEADALTKEFNRLMDTTQFNSRDLLKANLGELRVQFGYGLNGSIGVNVGNDLARNVGAGTFGTSQTSVTTSSSGSLDPQLFDFNGDGKLDVLHSHFQNFSIQLGNGDGTFGAEVQFARPTGGSGGVIGGAADVNGDGKLDVVVGNVNTGDYNTYLGRGDGTFAAAVSGTGLAAGFAAEKLADVNGDGRADRVSMNQFSNSGLVFVSLANSDGTFQTLQSYSLGTGTNNLANLTIADFDGDGRNDVALTTGTNAQMRVLTSDGRGGFSKNTLIAATGGFFTAGIASGDFDGDGSSDIAFVSRDDGRIYVYKNDGAGNFSLKEAKVTGNTTQRLNTLSVADMNGDGILDFLTADYATNGESGFRVYLGNGDGTMGDRSQAVGNMTDIFSFGVGDLNGDGVADVILGNGAATMSVYTQDTTRSTKLQRVSLATRADALDALGIIDAFQRRISLELGAIGAFQSRLNAAARVTEGTSLEYRAASGRITDADMGAESSNLTRAQILRDAGAAVLAQANQQPALALQLLR
jgi:flagellin